MNKPLAKQEYHTTECSSRTKGKRGGNRDLFAPFLQKGMSRPTSTVVRLKTPVAGYAAVT